MQRWSACLAISRMPGRSRYWLGCGALLAIGAILFGGELTLSALTGHSPSPIAAPAGGWAMILGWLGVALGGGRELFTAS